MPGIVCQKGPETAAPDAIVLKRVLRQNSVSRTRATPLDLPEICDLIAPHLDHHTLTVLVRVSKQWYATWIRHLWKRVHVDSQTADRICINTFSRLNHHIRRMAWSNCTEETSFSIEAFDPTRMNLERLELSDWKRELDAEAFARLVRSSSDRLLTIQLHRMSRIRGDLLKTMGPMSYLRHFSLIMDEHGDSEQQQEQVSESTQPHSAQSQAELVTALTSEVPRRGGSIQAEFTSTDSLPELLSTCPKLRSISLEGLARKPTTGASSLSDLTGVDASADAGALMASGTVPTTMHSLTSISLHGSHVSGTVLSTLFQQCPNLIKLSLGQTTALFISGFQLDITASTMNSLSTLVLAGCNFIDGHGFKEIFSASPKLATVDLSSTNVDDTALLALGHRCQYITDLTMDRCRQITDQGIRDLFSHRPTQDNGDASSLSAPQPYKNTVLQFMSVTNCTEITGQGINHILMSCAALKGLEFQQPEIMPESIFPHTLETDDDDESEQTLGQDTNPSDSTSVEAETSENDNTPAAATLNSEDSDAADMPDLTATPWACSSTLEWLRINHLDVVNPAQTLFLNARLRELEQLRGLHIGGRKLEISVLDGFGHRLEQLYISELVREVDLKDAEWLATETPNLRRLWCRQLIRHSESWKRLKSANKQLRLW